MTTILLSGASGFLGKILKQRLEAEGNRVISLGRGQSINIDISNPFSLDPELEVDVVIHAAGKAHSVPKTNSEKQEFFQVNHQGTINFCNAIDGLRQKPEAFIFISTVSVYGVDEGLFISEEHPLNGDSPYAVSKIQAEQYLTQWVSDKTIALSILRLPLIAGPNPPGNLGAMINGIKTGKYLTIGRADAKKSVVWAEDIATIIPKLAEIGGTYNLTDRYHPTFGELENAISQAFKKSKPSKIPYPVAKFMALIGDIFGLKAPINSAKLKKITSTLIFEDSKAVNVLKWSPKQVLTEIRKIN